MNTKSFAGDFRVKDADKGEFSAVFSTFNVVDSDGDVTLPGAFEDGTEVRISAYGHASWGGVLPVGKGVVRVTDKEALVEGQFFMDVPEARSTFLVVKNMGSMQEWSYSVEPEKYSFGEYEGQPVQFLEKLKGPCEVSPVLAGAGVGTRTLMVKGAAVPKTKRAIAPHETEVVARPWDAHQMLKGIPGDARPSELRSIYAWVDPEGDPEVKASYGFPHHHGVGGPANVRACLAGIAVLNGARGAGDVAEIDRKGIYDHLSGHLRDADREPPELRSGDGIVKMNDEAMQVLADLSGLIDRAVEVGASRAAKGKGLTRSSLEILGWVTEELDRLKGALANPQLAEEPLSDDHLATLMRAVARVNGI